MHNDETDSFPATTTSLEQRRRNIEYLRDNEFKDFNPDSGILSELTIEPHKLKIANEFEQKIWMEEGYGSLDEYEEHIKHAITFASFNAENECKAIARLFQGKNVIPPFITELPFYDNELKRNLISQYKKGTIQELGTIAVSKELRNGFLFETLARMAYRYSYTRGIQYWGIIMEPGRVEKMNKNYGFTFKQLGDSSYYQGGYCAPFLMNLQEVNDSMSTRFPDIYNWFVKLPLNNAVNN